MGKFHAQMKKSKMLASEEKKVLAKKNSDGPKKKSGRDNTHSGKGMVCRSMDKTWETGKNCCLGRRRWKTRGKQNKP